MRFDLKLADGRTVEWDGADGEDASRRYVDAQRVAGRFPVVVAWRRPTGQGTVTVLGRGVITP